MTEAAAPFKFTATRATEKIKLTVEIVKELDLESKPEEEISFGDLSFKITKVSCLHL